MKELVLQEIQKYGRGTSLRMVPRIFNTRGITRAVWSLTFLLGVSIMLWNVTMIFTDYFRWPVSSIFKEGTGRPLFPDVTVCNKYLTVYSSTMHLKWDDYINMTSIKKKMFPYDVTAKFVDVTKEGYENIWSLIQSPSGYISSLPISEFYSKSVSGYLITSYKYADWNGFKSGVKLLETPAWSPDFGACYTLKPGKTDASKVRALNLVLYINDLPEILLSQLRNFPNPNYIDTTGVRVIVHAPGTKPNTFAGVDIAPGTRTTLHVLNTVRTRQQWPYGNCTKQKYLEEPRSISDQDSTELYTKDACYDVCLQRFVIEACGCVTGSLQFTRRQLDLTKGIICGNQSLTSGDSSDIANIEGFKQLACLYSVDFETETCENQCQVPCEEYQYDVAASSAPWPHVSTQLNFYTAYVAPMEKSLMQGERFQVYQSLIESNSSSAQVIKELKEIHLLEDNFINLKIIFDKNYPMLLKETPSYLPEMVLSQIGGTLAVWVGMSVENVVEWFALIVAIISALCRSNRKKSLIPDNKSNTDVDEQKKRKKSLIADNKNNTDISSLESRESEFEKSRERNEYSNPCEISEC